MKTPDGPPSPPPASRYRVGLGHLQKKILHTVVVVLWISGAAWFYLQTIAPSAMDEGFQTSSSQPLWLKLHGAAAMVFLVVFGTLLVGHMPMGWRTKHQRLSGVSLFAACASLILTGWGLYYFGDRQLRDLTSWVHTAIGLGLPLVIAIHAWPRPR